MLYFLALVSFDYRKRVVVRMGLEVSVALRLKWHYNKSTDLQTRTRYVVHTHERL